MACIPLKLFSDSVTGSTSRGVHESRIWANECVAIIFYNVKLILESLEVLVSVNAKAATIMYFINLEGGQGL